MTSDTLIKGLTDKQTTRRESVEFLKMLRRDMDTNPDRIEALDCLIVALKEAALL